MEEQSKVKCPFCKSELDAEATVCHHCNAAKGVGYSLLTKRLISKDKAFQHLLIFGSLYIFSIAFVYINLKTYTNEMLPWLGLCLLYAVVMTIPVARFLGLSFRGERWFR